MSHETIFSVHAHSLKELALNPDLLCISHSGVVNLQVIEDKPDGVLRIAESGKHIPFEIKRVYFIDDFLSLDAVRGKHAHKRLKQAIFTARGSFKLNVDDGYNKQTIIMDTPNVGIILDGLLWHEMTDFSKDCLILVYADDKYNEADYVRDYAEFMRLV